MNMTAAFTHIDMQKQLTELSEKPTTMENGLRTFSSICKIYLCNLYTSCVVNLSF